MAASLGYYFRLYPEVFSNLDAFIFNGGVERFNEYIQSHPDDLNQYINQKILPEKQYDNYKDFKWIEQMGGEDEKLRNFADTIWQIMDEYEEAKKQAIADDRGADSDYYKGQIEALKKENVLEYLSKYCVIPKYGFPVDVVDLQIYEKGVPQNNYAMSRDLKVAISEYAPDSEVIVDKKKYTSKYITLKRNSEFTKNWFVKCHHCDRINIFVSRNERVKCKYCGREISTEMNEYYIEPRNGFKTGEGKESLHLKPKRSYAGEVIYLGGGKPDDKKLAIGNCMFIETSSEDRMLVMNKSSFYLCPTCGYSEIDNAIGKFSAPQNKVKHKNFKQYSCSCDTLEKVHLGHKFETDVTRFTIPMLYNNEKTINEYELSFNTSSTGLRPGDTIIYKDKAYKAAWMVDDIFSPTGRLGLIPEDKNGYQMVVRFIGDHNLFDLIEKVQDKTAEAPKYISKALASEIVEFMESYDRAFGYTDELEGQSSKEEWINTVQEAFSKGEGKGYVDTVLRLKEETTIAMKQAVKIETELIKCKERENGNELVIVEELVI